MSDPNQPSTPPGWYPDGQGGQRWWDGSKWTEHTQSQPGGAEPAGASAPEPTGAPGGDLPTQVAPPAGAAPGGDLPTQVAPNRAANYASEPPQQQVYGAPAGGAAQPGAGPQTYGSFPGGATTGGPGGSGGKGKLIAIIGGAVAALVLLLVVVFVLFNFVLGGGPDDVAKDYVEAQLDRDHEKQCDLSAEELQDELLASIDADDCSDYADKAEESEEAFEDQIEEFEEVRDDTDIEIEAGDVEEDGDEATVELTIKYEYTGDDEAKAEEVFGEDELEGEDKGEVILVKEDGDWKVKELTGDIA